MEIFDYLNSFKNCCDIDSLKKVSEERSSWPLRKNTNQLWENLIFFPHFHLRLLLALSGQI